MSSAEIPDRAQGAARASFYDPAAVSVGADSRQGQPGDPPLRSGPPGALRRRLAQLGGLYASLFHEVGWRDLSIRTRELALKLDPDAPGGWVRLASYQRLAGRRIAGIDALRAAEAAQKRLEARAGDARSAEQARKLGLGWARIARAWIGFSNRRAAERALARAVALAPDRPGVWTAYGRLLGYRGDDHGCLDAHLRAVAVAPGDAGVASALADIYAAQGREATAVEIHAARLPRAAMARHEAQPAEPALAAVSADPGPDAPMIVIDLTDLLTFLKHRRFVSGIQRVQAELALSMIRNRRRNPVLPAFFGGEQGRWLLLDPHAVCRLIDVTRKPRLLGRWRMQRRVARVMESRDGAEFLRLKQPVLFNPGASWSNWRYLVAVREAKRRQGLRFVPFVHDCIPLILPETCSRDVPPAYSRWLAGASVLADAFVVNSERTGFDLKAMLSLVSTRAHRIGPAPIDGRTGLALKPAAPRLCAKWREALSRRSFAIMVGSFEPRKNHLLVLKAWRELVRRHGDRMPVLVLIGRAGWRDDEAFRYFDETPELRDAVAILPDVSDAELAWFYANARFSLCASVYEGWGMPVTESFCADLPVLCARNSALIEAGGRAATFFNSGDLADLIAKVEGFALDERVLASARARIADAPLRPWRDVAQDAVRVLNRVAREPIDARRLAPRLELGRRYDFTDRSFGPELAVQEGAVYGQAWLGRDKGGLWTAAAHPARLALREGAGRQARRLRLELTGAPDAALTIDIRVEASRKAAAASIGRTLRIEASAASAVEIPLTDALSLASDADLGRADGHGGRFFEVFLCAARQGDALSDAAKIRGVAVSAVSLIG